MDMEIIGLIVVGWLAVALVISVALGSFLREINAAMDEDEVAEVVTKKKVLRYLRSRNLVPHRTTDIPAAGDQSRLVGG